MSEEAFGKKFVGALTRCLRQQLFVASDGDQVGRLKEDFCLMQHQGEVIKL
jgi:hypothetical protein